MQDTELRAVKHEVGPVLINSPLSHCIIQAIINLNSQVSIVDRGAYIRILAPRSLVLTRNAVMEITGEAFNLPSDLEKVMCASKGKMQISSGEVRWLLESEVE